MRNVVAGALVMASGAVASREGYAYGVGSLSEMGPGFFPFALGCVLLLLGGLIAVNGDGEAAVLHAPLDIRGGGCIVGALLLFLIVVRYGGLLPAAFVATTVAAAGDRTASLAGSVVLGLVAMAIAYGLFHLVLKMPLPLVGWG